MPAIKPRVCAGQGFRVGRFRHRSVNGDSTLGAPPNALRIGAPQETRDAAAVNDPTPNVAILGWGDTARTRGWGRSGRSVGEDRRGGRCGGLRLGMDGFEFLGFVGFGELFV